MQWRWNRGWLAVLAAAWMLEAALAQGPRQKSRSEEPAVGESRDREGGRTREEDRKRTLRSDRDRGEGEATEEGMPKALLVPPDGDRRERFWAGRWRLGVYTYDTDTGVVITRVLPGTPAWREGLEPRDVIVAVDGYQVGYVGRYLYPLGEELQRRADRNGRVTLLVQNRRDRRLLNLDVGLTRRGDPQPLPRRREPW
jgi:hypothetical protein